MRKANGKHGNSKTWKCTSSGYVHRCIVWSKYRMTRIYDTDVHAMITKKNRTRICKRNHLARKNTGYLEATMVNALGCVTFAKHSPCVQGTIITHLRHETEYFSFFMKHTHAFKIMCSINRSVHSIQTSNLKSDRHTMILVKSIRQIIAFLEVHYLKNYVHKNEIM